MELSHFFQSCGPCALAFSGGVDSAYLLYAALQAGADVQPYYVKTAFQPAFELDDARRLARELGAELKLVEVDILAVPGVAENPADRCYACKTALLTAIKAAAEGDGRSLLLDGTNASDRVDDRPGMRALRELGVRSPLREAGLTKDSIRRLSREAGLFTWDKPAYACLATRIPAGTAITAEQLERVEAGEEALKQLGYRDFRIRLYHGAARLQLPEDELERAVRERKELRRVLQPWFETILLDLEGR